MENPKSAAKANSLLSSSKNSQLQVQLHPLVILTISDYITRHVLRQQKGPIAGAILGSQHGRDVTMEHAFECKLEKGQGNDVIMDATWFHARLQQYKDVHKAPALDLVAWFTLAPPNGPQSHHLPIHQQLLSNYNESALLLLFHPSQAAEGNSKGGKLPLTIYETIYESATVAGDGDRQMTDTGGEGPQLSLRFQEIPFTIETGEAEMISIDFVARGGANASIAEDAKQATTADSSKSTASKDAKGKGKGRTKQKDKSKSKIPPMPASVSDIMLSAEDEDQIASLTAKANAIRMLQQRISLMKAYLQSIPPCYLTQPLPLTTADSSSATATTTTPLPTSTDLPHPILRQIAALLARLPLLTPSASITSETHTALNQISSPSTIPSTTTISQPNTQDHQKELTRLASDVALTTLLGTIGTTIRTTQKFGRKAAIFEAAKRQQAEKASMHHHHSLHHQLRSSGLDMGGIPPGMTEEDYEEFGGLLASAEGGLNSAGDIAGSGSLRYPRRKGAGLGVGDINGGSSRMNAQGLTAEDIAIFQRFGGGDEMDEE